MTSHRTRIKRGGGSQKDRPLKILHFINNLEIGGAEILLYNFVRHTQGQGVQHKIISLKRVGPVGAALRHHGVEVIAMGLPSPLAFVHHFMTVMRAIRWAECIHTWLYHANLIGGLLCWPRRPIIWSLHAASLENNSLKHGTRLVIALGRWLSFLVPARIIACGSSCYEDHARYGYDKRRMTVINNGVDVSVFKPQYKLKAQDGLFHVVHAARYDPQKDQDTLLEATALAVACNPAIRMVLCGKGLDNTNAHIVARISQLKLENYVTLLGPQSSMSAVYPAYNLFLMSSRYGEALPLALCEAMASGLPAVVTDVGDCKRIVAGSGLCVPPASASALAQAMVTMSRLPPAELTRHGAQARSTIATSYSFEKMSADYIYCYKTLCDRMS